MIMVKLMSNVRRSSRPTCTRPVLVQPVTDLTPLIQTLITVQALATKSTHTVKGNIYNTFRLI